MLKFFFNAFVLKLSRKSFQLWQQQSQENYENWIFTTQHIQTTSFPFLSSSFVQISYRKPLRWYRIADVKSHFIKQQKIKKNFPLKKKAFSSIPQNIGFWGKHQKNVLWTYENKDEMNREEISAVMEREKVSSAYFLRFKRLI